MTDWNSTAPDGTKSVKDNNPILQANTTYTETEMNVDHFWNIGADEDGRHKFAQMPKYTDGAVATPTSPTIGAGMDLAYFARLKTATEAVAQQDVQPYARNASAIMQILGIRSCAVFNVNQVTFAISVVYKHNVTSVARAAKGRYTITYDATDPMPSSDYLVLGGAMRTDAANDKLCNLQVASAAALNSTKTTTLVKVLTSTMAGNLIDPLQVWVVCFGG